MHAPLSVRPRPLAALGFLVALATGGIALPVLHEVAHVAGQPEAPPTHGGHHHHQLGDAHGTEAQPFCPEGADTDLVCALCTVHVASVLARPAVSAPTPATTSWETREGNDSHAPHTVADARGPPHTIA